MMATVLCVPIILDALYLPAPRAGVAPHADFSQLPYVGKDLSGVNSDTPYLSDEILSEPLEDDGFYLPAGIHLHWALPYALTRALHTQTGLQWPVAPNRWLVTRSCNGTVEQQWVVESDFLYPEDGDIPDNSITVPYTPTQGQYKPFRYMGRQLPLNSWSEQLQDRFTPFTAMGYGDPHFAALYPNCRSVFGFYDPASPRSGLCYDVIGWYANPDEDFLNSTNSFWLQHALDAIRTRYGLADSATLTSAQINEALENEFGWTLPQAFGNLPDRLACYASLTFSSSPDTGLDVPADQIVVATGNTGVEALSAYLATLQNQAGKAIVEEQLEALMLQSEGKNHTLDASFRFFEERHEKGFRPFSGGTVWTIRAQNSIPSAQAAKTQQPTSPSASAQTGQVQNSQSVVIPPDWADLLNTLNEQQHDLDHANDQADDLRRLLYADWCKYQRCAYPPENSRTSYPDPEEVRYFIEKKDLSALSAQINIINTCAQSRNQTLAVLKSKIDIQNQAIITAGANQSQPVSVYQLQPTPGQRYWRANDPVLLLAGAGIQPTARFDQDQNLTCQLVTVPATSANAGNITQASDITSLRGALQTLKLPFASWDKQPWNPYMLEWEVEVMPVKDGGNLDASGQGVYNTDTPGFIGQNFALQTDEIDLTYSNINVVKGATIYAGRSILTPQAGKNLVSVIQNWLAEQGTNSQDPAYGNIKTVFDQMQSNTGYYLSQSLGGFHQALLQQQQVYQLPIKDPLAFVDHQPFAQILADVIGQSNLTAPRPLDDFNPIRTGVMRLLNLRLVDTFGRTMDLVKDANLEQVITAESLAMPGNPNLVYLPPRLAQPARLNFNWLSADSNDVEWNTHPSASPICGWLMPNNLDGTLLVYQADGSVLGWIETTSSGVIWQPAPEGPAAISNIPNAYLQKVIQQIVSLSASAEADGNTFFQHFLSAVESALESIEPENFAQHAALALLMGRPIAVVRASLNLELKGLPAVNHNWNRFRQDLQNVSTNVPRTTDNFTSVKFPIRLGDYRQLNDGLVGYWVETSQGFENNTFYSPQSTDNPSANILTNASGTLNRHRSIDDQPETYTLLLDPRGVIHAHCGILPVRALAIPPDQYTSALKAIEVFFLSAPILTPNGQLTLPVPTEPGYKWSWFSRQNSSNWQESDNIAPVNLKANFPAGQQIVEGWLGLKPDDQTQAKGS